MTMFTVKWVVRTTLGEVTRMFEANRVEVAYRNGTVSSPSSSLKAAPPEEIQPTFRLGERYVNKALLVIDDGPGYAGHSFDRGVVYVMNEAGATVGKYVLDDTVIEPAVHLSEVA
jgi:hypothetical protein